MEQLSKYISCHLGKVSLDEGTSQADPSGDFQREDLLHVVCHKVTASSSLCFPSNLSLSFEKFSCVCGGGHVCA